MRRPRLAGGFLLLGLAAGCGPAAKPATGPVITLAESAAGHPTVAVDPRTGAFYVAWFATRDGESDVYLARSDDGESFSPPVRVNHLPGDAAPHGQAPAQVAAGPEGNVYVVWQNNTHVEGRRFPASDLRFARSVDGGRSFEPAIHVNDDAGGPPASHTFHDIAVADDGAVYVSWIDGRRRADSGDGTAPHDAGGHAGAHHDAAREPGPDIRVARSTDGGRTFGPNVIVDEDACPCCRTSLAAGPDGEVYVAWRKLYDGSLRDVAVARSTDGGATFDAPERVHDDRWELDACPHAGPSIVHAAGRLHAAWYTGRAERPGLFHAVAGGGTDFGPPAPLVTGDWVATSQARLAAGGSGVWAAWEDREAGTVVVAWRGVEGDGVGGSAPHVDGGSAASARAGFGRGTAVAAGSAPAVAAAGGVAGVVWQNDGAVRFVRLEAKRTALR